VGERVRVAAIGAGYWGINHVRVLAADPTAELTWICESRAAALDRARSFAPSARSTADVDDVFADPRLDAVVIATPAVSHADLATRALQAGKHVFVEKPLALNVGELATIEAAARASSRIVMVGHLMLYHPAVERLAELVKSGDLGDIYYLYATRVNLGRLRTDENALWSFAPHDVSMIDFLLGELPTSVTARGESYLQQGVEDVVFVNARYAGRQMAQIHLSWLDPHKERKLTVVGSKKMVVFDDVSPEKLRIYDKGYERPPSFERFDQYLTIRHGDIRIPHLSMAEPLGVECRHFLDCVRNGTQPRTDLASGARVVRVLAAAQESLDSGGKPVNFGDPS
jgi:predicted dehydrogenase